MGLDFCDATPGPSNHSAERTHRACSVRGCAQQLPEECPTKMCESCRVRHREYAKIKRAKRRMEKAAVAGLTVGSDENSPSSSNPAEVRVLVYVLLSLSGLTQMGFQPNSSVHMAYTQQDWDRNIDPRLLSRSSELAGALIPKQTAPSANLSVHVHSQLPSTSQAQEQSRASPIHAKQGSLQGQPPGEPPELPSQSELDAQSLSTSVSNDPLDISGPAKWCSIKGCKNHLPTDDPYKMCQNCRTRYKGYGTTKRAKRKARSQVTSDEQSRRQAEDESRAQAGLPVSSRHTQSLVDSH